MDKKKLAKVQKDIENKATLVAVSKNKNKKKKLKKPIIADVESLEKTVYKS